MVKKKFNQEQGSIDSKINQAPPEVRRRYVRNRAKAKADARSMEDWARHGFTSAPESDEPDHDVVRNDEEDVLW